LHVPHGFIVKQAGGANYTSDMPRHPELKNDSIRPLAADGALNHAPMSTSP
jgi:hypothetical protein